MSLWVKRTGQLFLAALFLMACEDEASLLGFKNPVKKFDVRFVELPVASSVIWVDSLRTSNYYFAGESNSLLVGSYNDPQLGAVTCAFNSQYFTGTTVKIDQTSAFDSASIELAFDFYSYGSADATNQEIAVYDLTRELKQDSLGYYFNKTSVTLGNLIGSKIFSFDPELFQFYLESGKDTTITVKIPLTYNFGLRIFDAALDYATATTAEDSLFVRYSEFVKEFNGVSVRSVNGDKVVGFNVSSPGSRLVLHYHDFEEDSLNLFLPLAGTVSFNEVSSDKTGSEVESLNQYYTDFLPASDLRFVQSGVGIFTKLDFTSYLNFLDTLSFPNVVINSAELRIPQIEENPDLVQPNALYLRVLEPNNRLRIFNNEDNAASREADLDIIRQYNNVNRTLDTDVFVVNNDSVFTVFSDAGSYMNIGYVGSTKSYRGYLTLFAQELAIAEPDKPRFKYYMLYPRNAAKTVSRVAFHKDNIKLRIYYTLPTVAN
jgi:hypothetical protein